MKQNQTKRQRHQTLKAQLESERSSFIPSWRDSSDYILPRRARFFTSDANKGDRRNQKIIDSTATMAAGTLRSGMMAGVTSPARPWFRLTTSDPDLAENGAVKDWLHLVETRMTTVFLRSNLYNILPILYGDMGTFGTGCVFMEEDFESVVRFYPFPIGSYTIANDHRLKVCTFTREFRMTVRQLIQEFAVRDAQTNEIDWSNFSTHVRSLYENNEMEKWIDVTHVIEPNPDFNAQKLDSKFKKYSSCQYETGTSSGNSQGSGEEKYLREKGYDFFPVLCPRWEVTGEDTYGTTYPGVTAIGDIKALQLMQRRKAEAVEKMLRPAMVGPSSLRNQKASLLPGDITYDDSRDGKGFRPVHEVRVSIQELLLDIQDTQNRIRRAFFEDLFLMLASSDRRNITAREIDERHEEKLLALGPVLEQLNQDLLDPLIDNTFFIMNERGEIPEAPPELQGMPLKVEYISIMAQAQKLVGISGLERFASFAQNLIVAHPQSADKIDFDQMLDEHADAVGIAPRIVRPDEDVAAMRQQQAQAQAAQQKMEMIQQGAGAAKDLSQTQMGGDSALDALLRNAGQ